MPPYISGILPAMTMKSLRRDRWKAIPLFAVFLVVGLLLYGHGLTNAFVTLDDDMLITLNTVVHELSPHSIARAFTMYDPELYIPLTLVAYQILYHFFGLLPEAYHLLSLLLHVANALLVFLFIRELSGRRGVALMTALLFLVHPLHVEAVMWASAIKDVLSSFFLLLSLFFYMRFLRKGSKKYLRWSMEAFGVGLLCKVSIIILPILLLLIDVREKRRIGEKNLQEKLPYFVLAVVFGFIAVVGKLSAVSQMNMSDLVLVSAKATLFQLTSLVWPTDLSVLYPYHGPISLSSPPFLVPVIFCFALGSLAVVLRKKMPNVLFCTGFFVLALFPSFFNYAKVDIYITSDRYAYIPSIGFFFLAVSVASIILNRLHVSHSARPLLSFIPLFLLSAVTFVQVEVWRNSETLFSHAIQVSPQSFLAYNNRGTNRLFEGRIDGALEDFKKALQINPGHRVIWSNLGDAYLKKLMLPEAESAYREALKIEPNTVEAHVGLGNMYKHLGRKEDSLAEYGIALSIDQAYVIKRLSEAIERQNGRAP
ncbi:tetratricopeptide repeat protein [Candidatus Peribacteria bacterium]|nr:tetratricopeptide repeat protein [Candidatus Peribacteria bacterium]